MSPDEVGFATRFTILNPIWEVEDILTTPTARVLISSPAKVYGAVVSVTSSGLGPVQFQDLDGNPLFAAGPTSAKPISIIDIPFIADNGLQVISTDPGNPPGVVYSRAVATNVAVFYKQLGS